MRRALRFDSEGYPLGGQSWPHNEQRSFMHYIIAGSRGAGKANTLIARFRQKQKTAHRRWYSAAVVEQLLIQLEAAHNALRSAGHLAESYFGGLTK